MSHGRVYHHNVIHIDVEGSQEVPSSINVESGGNGETTKNNYVTFISDVDEKPEIDIEVNEIVIPKKRARCLLI